jgi:hypothetical protein
MAVVCETSCEPPSNSTTIAAPARIIFTMVMSPPFMDFGRTAHRGSKRSAMKVVATQRGENEWRT